MRVTYDYKTDVAKVVFSNTPIAHSQEVGNKWLEMLIHKGDKAELIEFEILYASQCLNLSSLKKLNYREQNLHWKKSINLASATDLKKRLREDTYLFRSNLSILKQRKSYWEDEIEMLLNLRSEIEKIKSELKERNATFSEKALQSLDNQLIKEASMNQNMLGNFAKYRNTRIPKKYWWFWLDQLDTLTEKERSTL